MHFTAACCKIWAVMSLNVVCTKDVATLPSSPSPYEVILVLSSHLYVCVCIAVSHCKSYARTGEIEEKEDQSILCF